ncbi:MAG: transcriptional regulator [Deltaproteobacteria bacterium CG12_big_fil_rev_8_21_14_0_65_43_10]|nr:MAG: transcriptional regulator [Deltaproteobacteria bacterium CG2_30_43_15]PIQ45271.1 MAG: transcriptional regulator [Deltaproteobacteria bacterium CG12_big_fil_rev_8_21_14_0_65_43_10]PIU86483.1 MAG: XRE family transcriptional regulator [Deltaproteobacteria bacterium CG06_land_8_20_14_3_00_44_19]PIX23651.1 MAG: XRE family transcriptional regulator [Deltaproteobacteria bacterium CG_4_8_14_3_um_filter_43_13]PIZ20694.1 MAG: XRE family transcriptional regulator [Deltaproteobacteria bacterium CG_
MQVHTKKPPTDIIEIKFMGPIVNMAKAIETLKPLGFVDASESVPWREVYPECSEAQLIGKALAGARYREGLTQIALSRLSGIPQRHISEMENGKRSIGKEMAKRLGKALNISYKVFL